MIDYLSILRSLSIVRLHVSFGRLLFLLPSGIHRWAVLGIEWVDIRRTWPSHCHLRFCMTSAIGLMPARFLSSSFDIVFGQKVLSILRWHLFWNTSNFCSMVVVVFQYSAPSNKTLRMLLLNIFNLMFSFIDVDFQMVFSIAKASVASIILVFISFSLYPLFIVHICFYIFNKGNNSIYSSFISTVKSTDNFMSYMMVALSLFTYSLSLSLSLSLCFWSKYLWLKFWKPSYVKGYIIRNHFTPNIDWPGSFHVIGFPWNTKNLISKVETRLLTVSSVSVSSFSWVWIWDEEHK